MPIELHNTSSRVVIFPEFGGMLNNFFIKMGQQEIDIIYGYDPDENIDEKIRKDFRGVKLSPFPNRIRGGRYVFKNKTYQLPLNFPKEGNSIHGFLFDKKFKIKFQTDSQLILEYTVNAADFEGYPFAYELELDYILIETVLICSTRIKNTSASTIPIADGFHPYFRIGDSIDDLQLKLPIASEIFVDAHMIPTGEIGAFKKTDSFTTLENVVLDTAYVLKSTDTICETIIKSDAIEISIKQEYGKGKYNFLQVYTLPNRKAIAIEPMTAAPDCFNNQMGLVELKSGEEIKMSFQIAVR